MNAQRTAANKAATPNPGAPDPTAMRRAEERLRADTAERKRSVVIAGHRTSVSVEPLFWDALRASADARGLSLNALVGDIDESAAAMGSLSSALRVHVLNQVRVKAA
jgi:predicted DNA-binding ribbon-helix-helix protein